MLPHVVPLCKTVVDVNTFLKLAQQALGRSISQGVDSLSWSVNDLASFLAILGEMSQPGLNPIAVIRNPGHLSTHISLSFLVVMDSDTLMELMEKSRLFFTTVGTMRQGVFLSVVSGNLEDWRTTIINLCTERESQAARAFVTSINFALDKIGLGAIFSEYDKQFRPDSTIKFLPRG